ncbi:glycosyltransferase family 2 protein [Ahrensia kielensis]|uniref:Glycosyltransferase family 2 protein n=1 Tax=Ahrensia kielensis TaxID=76980 RepID=A0ABU9T2F6_9HYPH
MRYEFDVDLRRLILEAPSLIRSNAPSHTPTFQEKNLDKSRPEITDPSIAFLLSFGLPQKMLRRAMALAEENGTYGAKELIAFNGIQEIQYYQLLAKHLDVEFIEEAQIVKLVDLSETSIAAFAQKQVVWGDLGQGILRPILAPDPRQITRLEKILAADKRQVKIALTAPCILRSVAIEQQKEQLSYAAINQLYIAKPSASARIGASAWQGAIISIIVIAIALALSLSNGAAGVVFHLILSMFFACCTGLRLIALSNFSPINFAKIAPSPNKDKPVYSVMVALHDEAEVVGDLVEALRKLKWPRSKLEIKLVCEADDYKTIDKIKAEDLDPRFEIIQVPPSTPRTKPKALCYALGFTSGKFITLYDAEDRPHPEQLLEAYQRFDNADDKLGCLQAPLKIANAEDNAISSMFHFEYAGLFYGLIPWLARRKAPIMLGGTSNHFRRDALIAVGGWDPFNVTEDADIGIRLWRHGYNIDTITRPTLEDAPLNVSTWIPQRTRWFKGWIQTWLVHMKQPIKLTQNASFPSVFILNILLTGTLASALLHPFVLAKAIYLSVIGGGEYDTIWITAITFIDWATVVLSYIGFIAMCWVSTEKPLRRKISHHFIFTPLYWLGISFAAWRAMLQLQTAPFKWEKTAHTSHKK